LQVKGDDPNLRLKVERLKDQQKKLIVQKEKELIHSKEFYNNRTKEVKDQSELRLFEVRNEQDDKLLKESLDQQEKLEKVQEDLSLTNNRLTKEKSDLIQKQDLDKTTNTLAFKTKVEQTNANSRDSLVEIMRQSKDEANFLKDSHNQNLSNIKRDTRNKSTNLSNSSGLKIQKQQKNQDIQISKQKTAQLTEIVQKEMDHRTKMDNQMHQNTRSFRDQKRMQQKEIQQNQAHHKQLLTQEVLSFKQKFKSLQDGHNKVLTEVQKRFSNEIDGISRSHLSKKKLEGTKGEDPFYHLKTIAPIVQNLPGEYHVSLKVPEHERENLFINADKRKIRITLTRNSANRLEGNDGTIDQSKRSELFIKSLNVPDIIDPANITQNYSNGTLTFKLKKM
jgi:HSP20 family molecular chaperone IbpA